MRYYLKIMFDAVNTLINSARADTDVAYSSAPMIAAIIMNIMIYASFTASVLSFAYAAILITTSRGDGGIKQAAAGKSALVGSIVAGILGVSAVAVKTAVVTALGVEGSIANSVPTL